MTLPMRTKTMMNWSVTFSGLSSSIHHCHPLFHCCSISFSSLIEEMVHNDQVLFYEQCYVQGTPSGCQVPPQISCLGLNDIICKGSEFSQSDTSPCVWPILVTRRLHMSSVAMSLLTPSDKVVLLYGSNYIYKVTKCCRRKGHSCQKYWN